jgi:anthranilate phosphoribosyltransferase
MNAGGALYVAGISDTLKEGTEAAAVAIDDGSALDALESLREATRGTSSTGL